jgi:hypothetical protein
VLNWAVKFFADSLMLEADVRQLPLKTGAAQTPS